MAFNSNGEAVTGRKKPPKPQSGERPELAPRQAPDRDEDLRPQRPQGDGGGGNGGDSGTGWILLAIIAFLFWLYTQNPDVFNQMLQPVIW